LQGPYLTTDTNNIHFPIFVGQKELGQTNKSKIVIFWVYVTTLADTGFGSAPLKRTKKIQPESKNSKHFDNFSSNPRQLFSNFLDFKLP